jgi:hypothetical protein
MRSVVVVLPASMCAMIPMFRVSARDTCRAMTSAVLSYLPKSKMYRRDYQR